MENTPNQSNREGFVTLHVPSKYSYLRIVRQSVMDICARMGASEYDAAQLEMAVDEACANIIEHSYGGEKSSNEQANGLGLRMNLLLQDGNIVVELYDYGKGFDFESYSFPAPEQYIDNQQERGLGMYIIHQFVDEIRYERDTGMGNCLRLTKKLG